jgi:hypothetical protein
MTIVRRHRYQGRIHMALAAVQAAIFRRRAMSASPIFRSRAHGPARKALVVAPGTKTDALHHASRHR